MSPTSLSLKIQQKYSELPDFKARESCSGTAGQDSLGRAVVHNCLTSIKHSPYLLVK
jgi:hypothetical protein